MKKMENSFILAERKIIRKVVDLMVDKSKLNVIYFANNKDVIEFFETVTIHSWTWERLTEEERYRFLNLPVWKHIKGTKKQRLEIFHAIYHAFLVGLGYDAIGWRETEEVPQF